MKVICPRESCVWGKDGLCIRIRCPYMYLLPQRGAAVKPKRRQQKQHFRKIAKGVSAYGKAENHKESISQEARAEQ